MTVRKLDVDGREVWSYPAVEIERGERFVRVEALFDRQRVDRGLFVFERGDRFLESFYTDRWYNIFEVHAAADGRLKGWYCNVTRPAHISEVEVSAIDLALDVWIDPEGRAEILDEEEFAALDIDAVDRRRARAAVEEIMRLLRARQPPFDAIG